MSQSESYEQTRLHVMRFVRSQSVDGRIRAMVLDLVNQALRTRSVQLTNQDKDSLTHDVMQNILLEMLKEYQDPTSPN